MQKAISIFGVVSLVAAGFFGPFLPSAEAAKPKKRSKQAAQEVAPVPVPIQPGVVVESGDPCCEHKCCRKRERKCRHECVPAGPPVVEYKGCPAPCSVEKIVTVTHPKTCVTIEVIVQVPADRCEKVDRDRDGDLELDYGKYEVSLEWRDGGRRLIVDYDD